MNDKVVFLAFRNKNTESTHTENLTCGQCKNMTFEAYHLGNQGFPILACCVCGSRIGYFGWVDESEVIDGDA